MPLDRWQWHRLDYWDVSKPVARLDFNRKWLTQVKLYKDKLNKLHGLIADKAINTINQDTEHTVVRQFTENLVEEIVDAKKNGDFWTNCETYKPQSILPPHSEAITVIYRPAAAILSTEFRFSQLLYRTFPDKRLTDPTWRMWLVRAVAKQERCVW